ncbi:STAS domain-containing protein [Streptomyces sp. WAC04114]|nr:STAS domain-containing protein [Streptomyces sp. WAC04114]MBX9359941.1 STAS domain-containing protein [Streptomyces sp. WAC04114]
MPPPEPAPHDETATSGPSRDDRAPHEPAGHHGKSRLAVRPEIGERFPPVLELRLEGELDTDTSAGLRESLSVTAARSAGGLLILNLSAVTFCDVASLYTLLSIRQTLPLAGIDVVFTEPSAVTRAAARKAGLTGALALPQATGRVPPRPHP